MSRHGYTDDDQCSHYGLYRANVERSIRGRRGQQALRELAAALDAMPVRELVADSLIEEDGRVCALGCLGRARGIDMSQIDPEDGQQVAKAFDISESMAREIMFENDDWDRCDPAGRWRYMRSWVARNIIEAKAGEAKCPTT